MKIGVTSENQLKVDATRNAYQLIVQSPEIIGYSTFSGVGENPINENILVGARNRITDLRGRVDGLDRIVSIENGLFQERNLWVDKAAVVVFNCQKDVEHIAYSEGIVIPLIYVEQLRLIGFDKTTIGKVMVEAGYVTDHRDPHKSISGKSRKLYIEETVKKLVLEFESS